MPTIASTIQGRRPIDTSFPGESSLVTWSNLANGDDGAPLEYGAFADRSIQFSGTFGAGGTVVFEGSNDGVTYVTLTDPQGNAISKTGAAIEAVTEATRYVRPRVTGGDGTTSISAYLFLRA
jgi:hypothetical protein